MNKVTISKWVNSIAIRLPRAVTDELRLSAGDVVNLDVSDGRATIEKPRQNLAPPLDTMIAEMDRIGWENEPETVA
jgi:antitoxin MazE